MKGYESSMIWNEAFFENKHLYVSQGKKKIGWLRWGKIPSNKYIVQTKLARAANSFPKRILEMVHTMHCRKIVSFTRYDQQVWNLEQWTQSCQLMFALKL